MVLPQDWFDIDVSSLPMIKLLDDMEQKILSPLSCIHEHESKWILEFDLPLVDKKDINVYLDENNAMVIEAKLKEKYVDNHTTKHFEYEFFKKSIKLPNNVDKKNVVAHFSNGRLAIILPKIYKGNKIKIQ